MSGATSLVAPSELANLPLLTSRSHERRDAELPDLLARRGTTAMRYRSHPVRGGRTLGVRGFRGDMTIFYEWLHIDCVDAQNWTY
jgi:hypothetical protein